MPLSTPLFLSSLFDLKVCLVIMSVRLFFYHNIYNVAQSSAENSQTSQVRLKVMFLPFMQVYWSMCYFSY